MSGSVGPRRPWWARHRSLATAAATVVVLSLCALVLTIHLWTSTSAGSPHNVLGDMVYFGVIAAMAVLAASLTIAQQRSRPGANPTHPGVGPEKQDR